MEYLFDTNIFVESKKNLPMDIWPTFWGKMIELIRSGSIHSIDKVKEEIDKGGDEPLLGQKIIPLVSVSPLFLTT